MFYLDTQSAQKEIFLSPYAPFPEAYKQLLKLKEYYERAYSALSLDPKHTLLFTASKQEAIATVYHHIYCHTIREKGMNHLLLPLNEEAPLHMGLHRYEALGCKVDTIPLTQTGALDLDKFKALLSPRTALISLSLANALTGSIHPLYDIIDLIKERNIALHLDLSSSFGKIYFDYDSIEPDFITLEGAPLGAPPGVAILAVHQKHRLEPLIVGGEEQGGLRAGGLYFPLIEEMVIALEESKKQMEWMATQGVFLRNHFEKRLHSCGAISLLQEAYRLPHVSVMAFPKVTAEALLFRLVHKGVLATLGGGLFQKLSHQLMQIGISSPLAQSALSFSFSPFKIDLEKAIDLIQEDYLQLKKLSEPISWD